MGTPLSSQQDSFFDFSPRASDDDIPEEYCVLYVEIVCRAENWYLDCFCKAADSDIEIPELAHNKSVRLDRISAIAPATEGEWENSLQYVEVILNLYGLLAHSYESHPDDVWLPGKVRQVTLLVSSWQQLRDMVLQYGSACEVVSPKSIRTAISKEIEQAYK